MIESGSCKSSLVSFRGRHLRRNAWDAVANAGMELPGIVMLIFRSDA